MCAFYEKIPRSKTLLCRGLSMLASVFGHTASFACYGGTEFIQSVARETGPCMASSSCCSFVPSTDLADIVSVHQEIWLLCKEEAVCVGVSLTMQLY